MILASGYRRNWDIGEIDAVEARPFPGGHLPVRMQVDPWTLHSGLPQRVKSTFMVLHDTDRGFQLVK
jgi:hypothetical protein